jgi:hypothetical protein
MYKLRFYFIFGALGFQASYPIFFRQCADFGKPFPPRGMEGKGNELDFQGFF